MQEGRYFTEHEYVYEKILRLCAIPCVGLGQLGFMVKRSAFSFCKRYLQLQFYAIHC